VIEVLVNLPSPIPELKHALYPRSVESQGACPNFVFFRCFHLRFTFEFIKEVGSVSLHMTGVTMSLMFNVME